MSARGCLRKPLAIACASPPHLRIGHGIPMFCFLPSARNAPWQQSVFKTVLHHMPERNSLEFRKKTPRDCDTNFLVGTPGIEARRRPCSSCILRAGTLLSAFRLSQCMGNWISTLPLYTALWLLFFFPLLRRGSLSCLGQMFHKQHPPLPLLAQGAFDRLRRPSDHATTMWLQELHMKPLSGVSGDD